MIDGGIRVQAIKKTDGEADIVHYGPAVITTSVDRSISALLGASVSVHVAMEVIKKASRNCCKIPPVKRA